MSRKENNSAGIQRRTGLPGKIYKGCLEYGVGFRKRDDSMDIQNGGNRVKKCMKIGVNKDIFRGQ